MAGLLPRPVDRRVETPPFIIPHDRIIRQTPQRSSAVDSALPPTLARRVAETQRRLSDSCRD
ncbi:MAG: hypothetical protein U0805_04570 [Pirellulales bacterium]